MSCTNGLTDAFAPAMPRTAQQGMLLSPISTSSQRRRGRSKEILDPNSIHHRRYHKERVRTGETGDFFYLIPPPFSSSVSVASAGSAGSSTISYSLCGAEKIRRSSEIEGRRRESIAKRDARLAVTKKSGVEEKPTPFRRSDVAGAYNKPSPNIKPVPSFSLAKIKDEVQKKGTDTKEELMKALTFNVKEASEALLLKLRRRHWNRVEGGNFFPAGTLRVKEKDRGEKTLTSLSIRTNLRPSVLLPQNTEIENPKWPTDSLATPTFVKERLQNTSSPSTSNLLCSEDHRVLAHKREEPLEETEKAALSVSSSNSVQAAGHVLPDTDSVTGFVEEERRESDAGGALINNSHPSPLTFRRAVRIESRAATEPYTIKDPEAMGDLHRVQKNEEALLLGRVRDVDLPTGLSPPSPLLSELLHENSPDEESLQRTEDPVKKKLVEKEQVVSQLCELFTLLHVFFK